MQGGRVSAVAALAYLDGKLRAQRMLAYDDWCRAKRHRERLVAALHAQGRIEALDLARQDVSSVLEWIEAQKVVAKDNGS